MLRERRILAGLVVLLCLAVLVSGISSVRRHADTNLLQRVELRFARTDWQLVEQITEPAELRLLSAAFDQAAHVPSSLPNAEPPLYRLELSSTEAVNTVWLTHDLRVFAETKDQELQLSAEAQSIIGKHISRLREQQFGELLPWTEASQLFPRYSVFTVTDLETGLSFQTQRRAGSAHADIQPLTKQDTAVLKRIYGGAWSWDRRAVIVTIGDRRIAASINGMPHGAGALANGFPGHHCLHFLGSVTHGGNNADPVHQLMVQRAAGLENEYLDQMSPERLQVLALEMAGQGDSAAVGLLINQAEDPGQEQSVSQITNIKLWSSELSPATDGRQVGLYRVSLYFRGDSHEHRANVTVTCLYHPELGKWLVEPGYLQQLINAK